MDGKKELASFIERFKKGFPQLEEAFTRGNCYYFAVILREVNPSVRIVYLPFTGHFCAELDGSFFDITGEIFPEEPAEDFEEYKEKDLLHYERIVRDCVRLETR